MQVVTESLSTRFTVWRGTAYKYVQRIHFSGYTLKTIFLINFPISMNYKMFNVAELEEQIKNVSVQGNAWINKWIFHLSDIEKGVVT